MNNLKYLMIITKREYAEEYLEFFKSYHLESTFISLGKGTATEKILDYFGIEKTEKILFRTLITDDMISTIFKGLKKEMDIGASGNGIGMTIPIDSIGGVSSLKYFIDEKDFEKKEGNHVTLEREYKFSLIITIIDKGYTDDVMDAARSVGARGGTVVRAKGTGSGIAKFFGISISDEKEIIYIVSTKKEKKSIMKAIMEKAGSKTEGHGIIFSLPVDNVVGLQSLLDD